MHKMCFIFVEMEILKNKTQDLFTLDWPSFPSFIFIYTKQPTIYRMQ